ncbi:TD and POZ domain-containing protein 3 [Caerostris extrusa]|uniref:TD and POZ domain-containing protein 3 n=1 Tax=Caerostris extrusa TaxID=172846 RepID=A0AAV4S2U0_CAEEX|nr:TD and POZ domain-containing protein 3 [Caerostris extrusa]
MDDETVRRMIQFMYTTDVVDLGWSSASDLYAAADRYKVLTLKEKCSSYLKANLRPSNACAALLLADLHHDEGLKRLVQDFILKHSWENRNRKRERKATLTIFDKYRTMNTFKYIRLREEGSLNVSTLKRAIVQKCDWAYENFEIAEMVQDSTMRTLQGRFRKEDDKNTCLRKSIDTLMTVGRIVRRTREIHKLYFAKLPEDFEETVCLVIAKVVDKVVEKYLQSMGLSNSLKFWRDLEDWHLSRENGDHFFCLILLQKLWNISVLSSNV